MRTKVGQEYQHTWSDRKIQWHGLRIGSMRAHTHMCRHTCKYCFKGCFGALLYTYACTRQHESARGYVYPHIRMHAADKLLLRSDATITRRGARAHLCWHMPFCDTQTQTFLKSFAEAGLQHACMACYVLCCMCGGKPVHMCGGKPVHMCGGKPVHMCGGKPVHMCGGKPVHMFLCAPLYALKHVHSCACPLMYEWNN
jgi:hypothetical protein